MYICSDVLLYGTYQESRGMNDDRVETNRARLRPSLSRTSPPLLPAVTRDFGPVPVSHEPSAQP